MQNIIKRATAETPPFFTKLRNIGLALTAVATALLTAPVTLPTAVTAAAGYLVTAGTVATIISQLTVKNEKQVAIKNKPKKGGAYGSNSKP